MTKIRITAIVLIFLGVFAAYFTYSSETNKTGAFGKFPFKLGLDLNGGTHLVYQADVSKTPAGEIKGAMSSLRQTIETRINVFGVAEPLVQVEESKIAGVQIEKLIVELPGVTDVDKAVAMIGKTPTLEFKLEKTEEKAKQASSTVSLPINSLYEDTGLTGRLLEHATLEFDPNGNPLVGLAFNTEGKALFAKITKENVGRVL